MMVFQVKGSRRICYVLLPGGFTEEVSSCLEAASSRFSVSMVIITGLDWNDDLTPWPAPGVFRKAKPFGGNASRFLSRLETEIIPSVEMDLGIENAERTIVGISLSGLFAVWAPFCTSVFRNVVGISASLWYDSITEWMASRDLSPALKTVALVLGSREKNSKEKRMAAVEDRTAEAVRILRSKGVECFLDLDDGTHFSPVAPRLETAFRHVFADTETEMI